ncbi:MAG: hypothetical protein AAGG51_08175 [Cyanobacteria bacterium P01_G01_bin.54]
MITRLGAGAIITDSDGKVFLVRIKRRGMLRWELPTRIRQKGESLFLTLYRCIEKESSSNMKVRIGRPICLGVNTSAQVGHQYYAMFFECKTEIANVKPIKDAEVDMPDEVRQKIIDTDFLDWRNLDPTEIHPQHQLILDHWSQATDNSLFSVISNADSELAFYCKKGVVESSILNILDTPDKYLIDEINQKEKLNSYQNPQSEQNSKRKMTDQPKIDLSGTFHAPINISSPNSGNQAENIEIHNINSEQNLEVLLTNFKYFIDKLKEQHPNIDTPQEAMRTIDAEAQLSSNSHWQNFLDLKRLWQGSKNAGLKIGEYFVENSVWGKGAIAFLEGVTEDLD